MRNAGTKRPPGPEPLRIRSVLLPLDGSDFAERAMPWAAGIARKARARLRLALVHQPPEPPPSTQAERRLYTRIQLSLRKSQRSYLRTTAARLRTEGSIRVGTAMLHGEPASALGSYIRDVGLDLVVMTTHGRGGLERAWLGSVADLMVRTLEIPILLIRPSEGAAPPPGAERILVPLDGSRRAEAVLPPAMAMARILEAELTLLQAVQPVVAMASAAPAFARSYGADLSELRRTEAEGYLEGVAEQVSGAGITARADAVLALGTVEAIRAASRAPGVGMIALATHGHGGLRRMVLGSVADKLVRSVDLPVLVTRPRGR